MNFILEDDIDFYSQLKNIDICRINNNVCLISGEELEKNCIELECNHKYNYKYIYNEAIQQKQSKNMYSRSQLKVNELKCPYCRNIQSKILPSRDVEGYDKIYGITYPSKYCMKNYSCCYVFKRGKRKGEVCNKKCDEPFCTGHKKYSTSS